MSIEAAELQQRLGDFASRETEERERLLPGLIGYIKGSSADVITSLGQTSVVFSN